MWRTRNSQQVPLFLRTLQNTQNLPIFVVNEDSGRVDVRLCDFRSRFVFPVTFRFL